MEDIEKRHQLAEKYIAAQDSTAAVRVLFELAVDCAKAKSFLAAESFRKRILEIDPMALSEIINSGEIIEQEKKDAIDGEHRKTWAKLYDSLTLEEANALYFSLKHQVLAQNEIVCAQGDLNQRLFFLNSGCLKMTYSQGNTEVLLKMVNPGQISGEDSFFSSSICTTSLSTASASQLSYLEPEVLAGWKNDLPVLESKLLEFASLFEKVKDVIKSKILDRRALKRIRVEGQLNVELLNSSGLPAGNPFRVDIYDISQGGICLMVRIFKKETARSLLGQQLRLGFLQSLASIGKDINQTGTIVAVKFHPFEDCSVHVRFNDMVPDTLVMELAKLR